MKKWFAVLVSIAGILCFTACGNSSTSGSVDKPQKAKTQADTKVQIDPKTQTEEKTAVAVVYFSGTGNTQKVAQKMADILDADIFEIKPEEPYTEEDLNYNDDNCRANQEMEDDSARPAIANDLSAVMAYDTVYIGHPIWWGTAPRIIQTFLETYDLSGKTIYTFCTSGGSGIEQSISDLQKDYPKLNILSGHRFSKDVTEEIKEWLEELK